MTAPSAPASPANAPNCTAHFVGVNVSSSRPMAVVPISRQTGPRRHAGDSAAPQQHREHAEQAQQQHQHGEAAGQRRVDAVLDGQEVIAQELLVPGDGRADDVFDAGRFGDGGQGLVAEHDDEDQRRPTRQRGQRRDEPVDRSPAAG